MKGMLTITIGIPGCGKTTWAKEVKANLKDHGVICDIFERDNYRRLESPNLDLNLYKYTKAREKQITEQQVNDAREALSKGHHVIIADTNLNHKTRIIWSDLAGEFDLQLQREVFDDPIQHSVHTCWKRNLKRHETVPVNVLMDMQTRLREYTGQYVYDPRTEAELDEAVIVDIDGTLAHMHSRGPFEWSKVGEDHLDKEVASYVDYLNHNGVHVFIFSGRDSVCRRETEEWLLRHDIDYAHLAMRPEGNTQPDYIVKEEMFDLYCKGKYNVTHVIDDRAMMCRHWETMNLRVWNVGGFRSEF